MPPRLGLLIGLVLAAGSPPASAAEHGQTDVSGVWRVDITHQRGQCRWQGQVRLDQSGGELTGAGEAAPSAGLRFCPLLKGEVAGTVDGPQVRFGFATGRLGTGEFDGTAAPDGRLLSGTWSARSAAGTWRAERID